MVNTNDIDNKKLIHLTGTFKGLISEVLKLSVFVYALGFIIVNAAFMKYGFMLYDVVSVKYLIAGLQFLGICALTYFVLFKCKNIKLKADRFYVYYFGIYLLAISISGILYLPHIKPHTEHIPRWIYYVVLYIFSGLVIHLFLKFNYWINTKWLHFLIKSALIILALVFFVKYASEVFVYLVLIVLVITLLIIVFSPVFFIEIKTIKKVPFLDDLPTLYHFVAVFLAIIFVSYLFGSLIYTKIDRMLGGGALLRAQLIISDSLKKEVINYLPDCSIDFNDTKLIYETPDSVFIALKKPNKKGKITLEIPKRNLIAIKYFKNK